jgi:hypothetical protein
VTYLLDFLNIAAAVVNTTVLVLLLRRRPKDGRSKQAVLLEDLKLAKDACHAWAYSTAEHDEAFELEGKVYIWRKPLSEGERAFLRGLIEQAETNEILRKEGIG